MLITAKEDKLIDDKNKIIVWEF